MIVLVIGSGGREHALVRAIHADPGVAQVHAAPGNPGMARLATLHRIDPLDRDAVASLARAVAADLVVIGPEAPLAAGVADAVRDAGIACFGPSAQAARLEASKSFAKEVMAAAGVPTARSFTCHTMFDVAAALDEFGPPYVVKDDGLAAGKGVVVTDDWDTAVAHAYSCGSTVVIEEYLDGPEVSLFAITDGRTARAMMPAQDFKRLGDGDQGPNTGGMGAYTPLTWAPDGLAEEVLAQVVHPTLAEMARRGTPFTGLLYVGLAMTSRGARVVEFNARFGDPETQALLALMQAPMGQVLHRAATGQLAHVSALTHSEGAAVTVVIAAGGYPSAPRKGGRITLPEDTDTAWILHAGTALDAEGHLVADGGRVLNVVAVGADVEQARERAYRMVEAIDFADGVHRTDIARPNGDLLKHALLEEHKARSAAPPERNIREF